MLWCFSRSIIINHEPECKTEQKWSWKTSPPLQNRGWRRQQAARASQRRSTLFLWCPGRNRGRTPAWSLSRSPETEAKLTLPTTTAPPRTLLVHPNPSCNPSRPPELQLQPLTAGNHAQAQSLTGHTMPRPVVIAEPYTRTQFDEGWLSSKHHTTRNGQKPSL